MPSQGRKHRGYKTQRNVADYLARNGYPYAESTGAGRSGADITGTPGVAFEVKARSDFSPLAWMRQASANAGDDMPVVVMRPNGVGDDAAQYLAILSFPDLVALVRPD